MIRISVIRVFPGLPWGLEIRLGWEESIGLFKLVAIIASIELDLFIDVGESHVVSIGLHEDD